MREYLIFEDRPAYPSRVKVRHNAYPTFGKPWSEIREFLPPTVCHYGLIQAKNKPDAIARAKNTWNHSTVS